MISGYKVITGPRKLRYNHSIRNEKKRERRGRKEQQKMGALRRRIFLRAFYLSYFRSEEYAIRQNGLKMEKSVIL